MTWERHRAGADAYLVERPRPAGARPRPHRPARVDRPRPARSAACAWAVRAPCAAERLLGPVTAPGGARTARQTGGRDRLKAVAVHGRVPSCSAGAPRGRDVVLRARRPDDVTAHDQPRSRRLRRPQGPGGRDLRVHGRGRRRGRPAARVTVTAGGTAAGGDDNRPPGVLRARRPAPATRRARRVRRGPGPGDDRGVRRWGPRAAPETAGGRPQGHEHALRVDGGASSTAAPRRAVAVFAGARAPRRKYGVAQTGPRRRARSLVEVIKQALWCWSTGCRARRTSGWPRKGWTSAEHYLWSRAGSQEAEIALKELDLDSGPFENSEPAFARRAPTYAVIEAARRVHGVRRPDALPFHRAARLGAAEPLKRVYARLPAR